MSPRWPALCLGAALGLISVGTGLGLWRVQALERAELAHEGPSRPLSEWQRADGATAVSARLASVELRAGEHAVFEVCADDPMESNTWRDSLAFAVFKLDPMELMLRVPLDAEHLAAVQRNADGACLHLGAGPIDVAGRYTLDAVWPDGPPPKALTRVPLRARILAKLPLATQERVLVMATALGCLLALLSGWLWRGPPEPAPAPDGAGPMLHRGRARARGLAASGAALVALVLASMAPLWGSTLGVIKGLLLASLQAAAALGLARYLSLRMPLSRPGRPAAYLALALATAPLLVLNARLAMRVVPSTGEAPIETFISWPSGMLAFAVLGVVLPLAEELFFRGFVYGALLPLGRATAFVTTVTAFALIHAQQSWGNWGALLAISGTGVILTGLRAATGSVLPCALAHVLYNLTLTLSSL